jgi:Icc-related predicted phosphoesterase
VADAIEDMALQDFAYLAKSIQRLQTHREVKKIVVVTHHAPSDLSVAECYKDQHLMNGAYRTNLEEVIMDSNIAHWYHGHTHHAFDYTLGNTRVVCNPRGYHGHEPIAENYKFKYLDI